MQLIIDIKNESIAEKIKTILNVFKDDGVKIRENKNHANPQERGAKPKTELNDEYIQKHWKELIITSGDNSEYYKSEQYYEDRAEDYRGRGKI